MTDPTLLPKRPRPRWAAFVAVAWLAAPAVALAKPADGLPRETWYGFNFHGRKVGFLHAVDERSTIDGNPVVHAHRRSVVTVRRQAHKIRMEATTDSWSDPKGRPLRFTHERVEAGEHRVLKGAREGKSFVIRHEVGGNLTTHRHPIGPDTYLASGLDVLFKKNLRPGKKLEGQAIVEDDGALRPFSIEVMRSERGDDGPLFVVESRVAKVVSTEWVRADGTTIRTRVDRLGAEFYATSREDALRMDEAEDIFSAARLLTHVQLPSGDQIDRLVVRMVGRSGRPPQPGADRRQKRKSIGKGAIELRIEVLGPPLRPPALPVRAGKPLQRYLSETPYEAIRDERLVSTTRKLVSAVDNAWDAARAINAFVYRHLKNKTLARAFSTANEALASGEGDCTEHAVLFSALAKIAKIPTRLVTGLVSVGGQEGVFGYHQWVEVWMGDRWVAMDPTFGQDVADPTHIKFTEGLSDADGLRDAGIAAAEAFGDIALEVVEYTTIDGKRVRI